MFVLLCIEPRHCGHIQSAGVFSSLLFISNRPSHSIQVSLWDVAFSVVISLQPFTPLPSLPIYHLGKFCTMFDLGAVVDCCLSRGGLLLKIEIISFFHVNPDSSCLGHMALSGLGQGVQPGVRVALPMQSAIQKCWSLERDR